MMSRWSHEAERQLTLQRGTRDLDRSARCSQGVIVNAGINWSVGIEIPGRGSNLRQVISRMGTEQRSFRSRSRFAPFPARVPRADDGNASLNAGRPLHVAGRGVLDATRIVENDQAVCSVSANVRASKAFRFFATLTP